MSASLVGSEMCIRDRSGAQVPQERDGAGRRVPADAQGLGRFGGRGDGPVSYTHLTLPTICSV
eukprot:3966610-Alexandrium_andersonii.AAC.1